MFFKRLEMHGFKSFATKTQVEFTPGVTGIVGPNGCGKSNVLDSLRWVLGEQRAKTLRGDRMHDVIFNGSSSLKALGYAQVALTLDNSDRALPIDQTEVQICRRLFRTGESEYQINKVNCRLRDVVSLFLDTGIGTDSYSIMEQGGVDQIINAKPAERREIFEEAAGISKYKIRREEALRKLARTDEDLVRLRDIIVEVERQCNSLKRQAQKAARYKRLKERERDLEQRLLARRAHLLEADLKVLRAEHRQYEDQLAELNARLAGREATQTELQEKHQALQRDLQQNQSLHYALRADLDRSMHDRDLGRQRLETARKRLGEIERELASARDRATVLAATLESLVREAGDNETALAARQEELATLSRQHEQTRRGADETLLKAGETRNLLGALNERRLKVENDQRFAQRVIERMEEDMKGQTSLIEQITADVAALEREVTERRAQEEAVAKTIGDLAEQRRALDDEIARHDALHTELQDRLEDLNEQHHKARSRLAALQELEDAFEGYYRGVKEVMVASKRGALSGVVGVVSSLIGVRKEFEIAIETALGGQVQDIVTDGVEDAKRAIELLKRGNLGRATFLPLDFLEADVRDAHLRGLLGREGVVGFARELVTYEPRLEIVARHLFGTTLVVNHVDVAVALKREGHSTRFVTLEGELVHPRGVLTGGSHQTRGLLSRSREIRQLAADAAALEKQLAELREQLRATKDQLNESYARRAELQQQAHEQEIRRRDAHKDLEAMEARLRERRNQLAQAESRAAQQRAERGRNEDTIATCATQMERLNEEIARRQAELEGLEAEAARRRAEVETAGRDVAERRIEVTALTERLTAARDKVRSIEADLATARDDGELREVEKLELEEDVALQTERIADAEERLAELTRRAELEERSISVKQQDLETQANELRRLGFEIQEILRDRNGVDNEVRERELRLTELKAQHDYVERETQEKFGLTVAQVVDEVAAREKAGFVQALAAGLAIGEAEDGEEAEEPEPAAETPPAEVAEVKTEAVAEESAPKLPKEYIGEDLTDPGTLRRLLSEARDKIARLGSVNTTAIEEYEEKRKRFEYLTTQERDLTAAKTSLETTIGQLDETCTKTFWEAFEKIRANFVETFRRLFNGGRADLVLQEPVEGGDPLEAGIEILAQPPGKKLQSISLMSGGEKAMTAIGLMFALFLHKPSPFCVLDEIDAPLDDANVGRFCDMVREFSKTTQFMVITHNKLTMSLADTMYGVTMQEPGVSKIVSVKFSDETAERLLAGQAVG